MKTRDLIRRLQEADPTGELECVVGGYDVYFVERLPMYYDGLPALLVHDPEKRDREWSVVGLRVPGSGEEKVRITTLDAEDVFLEIPDAPVEYGDDYARKHKEDRIEKVRAEVVAIRGSVKEADPKPIASPGLTRRWRCTRCGEDLGLWEQPDVTYRHLVKNVPCGPVEEVPDHDPDDTRILRPGDPDYITIPPPPVSWMRRAFQMLKFTQLAIYMILGLLPIFWISPNPVGMKIHMTKMLLLMGPFVVAVGLWGDIYSRRSDYRIWLKREAPPFWRTLFGLEKT